jgi:hypothetical protein
MNRKGKTGRIPLKAISKNSKSKKAISEAISLYNIKKYNIPKRKSDQYKISRKRSQ